MAAQTNDSDNNFKNAAFATEDENEQKKKEESERIKKIPMWNRYDRTFLVTYSIQSFNGGLKFLFMLSYQDLFKNFYKLEPTHTQLLSTLIFVPWVLKLLYGIVADTVPIFGSRKKSWLVIMGLLQFISLTLVSYLTIPVAEYAALLLATMSFSGAFIDVIMDALMVI